MEIRRDKYLDLLIHSCGNGLIKVIAGMLRNSAFQKMQERYPDLAEYQV